MKAFVSTYVNKLDKKGRVSVPASFRAALGSNSFFAYESLNAPAIDAIPADGIEQLIEQRRTQMLQSGDFARALMGGGNDTEVETILGMIKELPFDSEGRIVLPKPLVDFAGITEEVAFVGRGHRFQIWAPAVFNRAQEQAREKLRARLRDGAPPEGSR